MPATIHGFDNFEFTDGPFTHTVYRRGTGLAVLLMHEMPGMSWPCIDLANEIAGAGFTVFMPLLFGQPGDDSNLKFFPRLCISREFHVFASGGGSPIVDWLRALGRHALAQCGGAGIGAIGMCLTGNFAIALMADPMVLAPVASQPALPIGPAFPVVGQLMPGERSALGVTPEQLAGAQQRAAQGVKLMCLRFSNDTVSPRERFDALRSAFGAAFVPFLLGSEEGINSAPGNPYDLRSGAHSVLTREYQPGDPEHPSRLACNAVLAFLSERLA